MTNFPTAGGLVLRLAVGRCLDGQGSTLGDDSFHRHFNSVDEGLDVITKAQHRLDVRVFDDLTDGGVVGEVLGDGFAAVTDLDFMHNCPIRFGSDIAQNHLALLA